VVPIGKTPALHCSAELQRSRTLAFSKPKYSSPFKNPALPLMQGDAIGTRLWEPCQPAKEYKSEIAFAAFAAFRIEGLQASLNHAREIAVRDELDAIGHS
jgi:hypothetical protein